MTVRGLVYRQLMRGFVHVRRLQNRAPAIARGQRTDEIIKLFLDTDHAKPAQMPQRLLIGIGANPHS